MTGPAQAWWGWNAARQPLVDIRSFSSPTINAASSAAFQPNPILMTPVVHDSTIRGMVGLKCFRKYFEIGTQIIQLRSTP
jgi:hypothetical protein